MYKVREICNWCYKPKNGVQTGLCNHCGRFGKTDRELSMGWWNNLPDTTTKQNLCNKMYPDRMESSLTGREIQILWDKHAEYIAE